MIQHEDNNGSIFQSTKPFWITTRDAVLVTALTLVCTLIFTWLFFAITNTEGTTESYWELTWQTVVLSMGAQYLYEYTGMNNMLAESSIRYAKGGTLNKYVSRREALVYQCFYELLSAGYKRADLIDNFHMLHLILTIPSLAGYFEDEKDVAYMLMIYPNHKDTINKMSELPVGTRQILEYLADQINVYMVYDILVNGFADYKRGTGEITDLVFNRIENLDTLKKRGHEIAKKIKKDMLNLPA